jgi:hypothetical protein
MSRAVARSRVIVPLLAASTCLCAGCGAGHESAAHSPAVPARGRAHSARAAITKAQAVAYAHAVNLRATDVPGMTSNSSEGEVPGVSPNGASSAEFVHCYGGVSPARRVVKMHSPQFSAGRAAEYRSLESRVEVWPSSSLAVRNNSAYQSARGRRCFLRFLRADNTQLNEQRSGRLQLGPVRVSTVAYPLPGGSHSYRRTVSESLVRGRRVRVHIDHEIFTFLRGPAEVELIATRVSDPFSPVTQGRLVLALLNRAETSAP